MTNETIIAEITKENKKILKSADRVVFRLKQDGQSQFELYKGINVDGFKTEIYQEIQVGTKISNYENYGEKNGYEVEKACVTSMCYEEIIWQTIVKNIKIGDKIYLHWIAGNDNNYLRENNLSNDELHLEIQREKEKLKFIIDKQVVPTNSSVRMINFIKK